MSDHSLSKHLLIPNLVFESVPSSTTTRFFKCELRNISIKCPYCELCRVHIHQKTKRKVKDILSVHDNGTTILEINITRYRCLNCKKTFTPSVPGISPKARITERFRRKILWASDNFSDLKKVSNHFKIGNASIYYHYYKALNLKLQHRVNKPWPKRIGIDEHSFNKNKKLGFRNFVTLIVDHNKKRPFELLPARDKNTLSSMTKHIAGTSNVEVVTMDLSNTYRSFAKTLFPQAMIIADHFHVVRLLYPAINKHRYEITDKNRKHPLRKLLLKKRVNLNFEDRIKIEQWLKYYPKMRALYNAKERLHTLYQCRGIEKARSSFDSLIKSLEGTVYSELITLKNTLTKWREEILNYFIRRVTNARTEGFNNVAKSIIKRSYGLSNFANYRARLLNV